MCLIRTVQMWFDHFYVSTLGFLCINMCRETPRQETQYKQKVFLRHVIVEALQLISLLGQRQVQVQVVSIRRKLKGAIIQLRERQRQRQLKHCPSGQSFILLLQT